ncbi:MAG: DUF2958 domain-containing protein [Sphingomonas sp.]
MDLLTPTLRAALRANAAARDDALRAAAAAEPDPAPVVKFFNPVGAATWLATELDSDGETLFGLADLGFGCPELGAFSLRGIAALRLPFGLGIERDLGFASLVPLSLWADAARATGSISQAEAAFADAEIWLRASLAYLETNQLPPPDGGG